LQHGFNVCVADVCEASEGPVFADLREPADTAVLGCVEVGFGYELVEGGGLVYGVFFVEVAGQSQVREVVFFLYPSADCTESGAS